MVKEHSPSIDWQPTLYMVTGEQGQGKTSFLLEIIAELAGKGVRIRGIAAPGHICDGIRSGFSILDLATGLSEELCCVTPSSDCEKHGRFYFRSKGLSFGSKALLNPLTAGKTDLLVIDEVGRFEVEGAVWGDCIEHLVGMPHPPMIWTVRCCFVEDVTNRWPVSRLIVVDVGSGNRRTIIGDLLEEVRIYRSMSKKDR